MNEKVWAAGGIIHYFTKTNTDVVTDVACLMLKHKMYDIAFDTPPL
jgi:hypothetical protein